MLGKTTSLCCCGAGPGHAESHSPDTLLLSVPLPDPPRTRPPGEDAAKTAHACGCPAWVRSSEQAEATRLQPQNAQPVLACLCFAHTAPHVPNSCHSETSCHRPADSIHGQT